MTESPWHRDLKRIVKEFGRLVRISVIAETEKTTGHGRDDVLWFLEDITTDIPFLTDLLNLRISSRSVIVGIEVERSGSIGGLIRDVEHLDSRSPCLIHVISDVPLDSSEKRKVEESVDTKNVSFSVINEDTLRELTEAMSRRERIAEIRDFWEKVRWLARHPTMKKVFRGERIFGLEESEERFLADFGFVIRGSALGTIVEGNQDLTEVLQEISEMFPGGKDTSPEESGTLVLHQIEEVLEKAGDVSLDTARSMDSFKNHFLVSSGEMIKLFEEGVLQLQTSTDGIVVRFDPNLRNAAEILSGLLDRLQRN